MLYLFCYNQLGCQKKKKKKFRPSYGGTFFGWIGQKGLFLFFVFLTPLLIKIAMILREYFLTTSDHEMLLHIFICACWRQSTSNLTNENCCNSKWVEWRSTIPTSIGAWFILLTFALDDIWTEEVKIHFDFWTSIYNTLFCDLL